MTAVAIFGICLSLGLLMYLAYRGINVLLLAPLMALLAVIFNGGTAPQLLLGTYTQLFMVELGKYLAKFFPLFMLGALFGKVMDDSGSARVIAQQIARWAGQKQALLAIVLACGVLTYGGVSLFVVAFAVYPIAKSLFREQNIPKRLIPGAIALGSFTFTMTALPGTPAIQNAIPTAYFHTTPYAAPGLGTIGGLIMFAGGMLWLNRRAARAHAAGEGYGQHNDRSEATAEPGTADPGFTVALIPILLVIGLNFVFSHWVIPALDTGFLSQPKYGGIKVGSVAGIWSIVLAVACATLVAFIANRRRLVNIADTINKGTLGSMLPVMNTSSEVGYGGVISALPAFVAVRDGMTSLTSDPVVSIAITVNVLAAVTGSASGGLSIAMASLGDYYLNLAQAAHVSPEIMHRIASMSSGGFDCMPHNGAVITLLAICGLTHRESYFDIFVVASTITVIAGICVIILNAMFGTF
jgi:H+/gluconate symporter-like permease